MSLWFSITQITLVGDLKHGRTVHSLVRLLCHYKVQLRYVHPDGLGMPEHIREYLTSRHVSQTQFASLEEAVVDADIVYVTRIQKERFESASEYERVKDTFVVTPEVMAGAKRKMAVMHPLPRVNEIRYVIDFQTVDPSREIQ